MERFISLLAAAACLATGTAFFILTGRAQPKEQPEQTFQARVFTSKPVKPPRQRANPDQAEMPVSRKKTSKKSNARPRKQQKSRRARSSRPRSDSQTWQPVEVAGLQDPGVEVEASRVGPEWESSVQYYSGGSYGVAHINKHANKPGNGGYPNDRSIVRAAATKYGIPFALLWGTYGAESSWGKNTGGGELPPYFGLTSAYPGGTESRYRGTSGNFRSDAEKAARSWLKIYRLKNGGQSPG